MRALGLFILVSCLLLTACPPNESKLREVAEQPSSKTDTSKEVVSANSGANPPKTPPPPPKAVKQVILIYTGDTLSAMQPQVNQTPDGKQARLGGISALTAAILDYEASITAMARQRVKESGGDASSVKTDAAQGLLGEHPYLLLDYGGWERAEDPAGKPYVELQWQMYDYLHYAAVAALQYHDLAPALWKAYKPLLTQPVLCSTGAANITAGPVPAVPIVIREAHGAKWGVVAVPLPPAKAEDTAAAYAKYIDAAAAQLAKAKCDYGILLCKGAPQSVYRDLAADKRFTVVVGAAPPALAAAEGFGEVEAGTPIMLPQLDWGGQEFGTCHLIYPEHGASPTQYNFVRHPAVDDLKSPLPYRKQAAAAIEARKKLGGK